MINKLNKLLCGVREMGKLPQAMIIVDPRKEFNAIREARKLNIPVFGIVDTHCDPDMVDYVIPANDDAVRSVKLVIGALANAIAEVNGKEVINYISAEDAKENLKTDMKELLEDTKALTKEVTKKVVKELEEKHHEVKKEVKEKQEEVKKEIKAKKVEVVKKVKEAVEKKVEKSLNDLTLVELKEMAKEISKDYAGENLLVIGLLKGASYFLTELTQSLTVPTQIDFIKASSYGSGSISSGHVDISFDTSRNISGKNVLIVDDVVDTGITLHEVKKLF